jgi:hypothetical protein
LARLNTLLNANGVPTVIRVIAEDHPEATIDRVRKV